MKIEFLGQACFLIEADGHTILTDPFLTGNPVAAKKAADVNPTHILVSHAHMDHMGDAAPISKASGATVYTTFEIVNQLKADGVKADGGNIGGWMPTDFGRLKFVQAIHGSGIPGGVACGFVIELANHKIYFAGDTALYGDMAFLAAEKIDVALLPIGDLYTMGPEDAAMATGLIEPTYVIPMHYNTFPGIAQDPSEFKDMVESSSGAQVIILAPGEAAEF